MKLLVDIGNSRLKWARWIDGRLEPGSHVERREPLAELLDSTWSGLAPPEAALVSSVAGAGFNEQMTQWMAARWGCQPAWFRCEPQTLGITNGYADPSRLGTDRWAAVIGARAWHAKAVGIIDCGTAVTLDLLDDSDRHLGGWIFPGLTLCQWNLSSNTANIREMARRMTTAPGRSTAECVANGVLLGLAGAVARWMAEAERILGGMEWIATGGDWPRLRPLIHRSIRHDPDLVLRGLARTLA